MKKIKDILIIVMIFVVTFAMISGGYLLSNILTPQQNTQNNCVHSYLEETSTASCTNKGSITYKCRWCDKIKIENNILKEHEWIYSSTNTLATCTTNGSKTYKCKNCLDTKTEKINALGHDYKHRTCTRCEYSPLYFSMSFSLNSVGGIKTYIIIKNTGTKRIKYISFNCYLYNSVDDKVKDEIYGLYAIPVQLDGYFEISDKSLRVMDGDIIGYCKRCASIVVEEIKITYSDGSYEFVPNNYKYS